MWGRAISDNLDAADRGELSPEDTAKALEVRKSMDELSAIFAAMSSEQREGLQKWRT
jgi:hypothetical protein